MRSPRPTPRPARGQALRAARRAQRRNPARGTAPGVPRRARTPPAAGQRSASPQVRTHRLRQRRGAAPGGGAGQHLDLGVASHRGARDPDRHASHRLVANVGVRARRHEVARPPDQRPQAGRGGARADASAGVLRRRGCRAAGPDTPAGRARAVGVSLVRNAGMGADADTMRRVRGRPPRPGPLFG